MSPQVVGQGSPIKLLKLVDIINKGAFERLKEFPNQRYLPKFVYLGHEDFRTVLMDSLFFRYCVPPSIIGDPLFVLGVPVIEVCLPVHCEVLW